jgi:hypothetical protein
MKDNLPFVSVIITNYNGKMVVKNCINSVLAMNYPKDRLEIILVDDHSYDGSVDFVKKEFPDVKIIRNDENRGVAESKNIGVKCAKADTIAFLDNDVEVSNDWLSELVKAMREDKQIGICASKIFFKDNPDTINSAGGVMNIYADAWDRGIYEKDIRQYNTQERVFYGCRAKLIKKEVLERIGYFDPTLYIYEDVDLGWRANLLGYKISYIPSAIAYHRFEGVIKWHSLKVKYLIERSRTRIMLKNYEGKTLLKNMAGLLKFRLFRFRIHIKSTQHSKLSLFIRALAAWGWNLLHILDTLRKRIYIQRTKIINDREIFKLMGKYKYESLSL